MRPAEKYLLLQVPGWLLAAAVAFALSSSGTIPAWLAVTLFVFWVGKDFVLYPLLRNAYRSDVPTGAARLVGRCGTVRKPLVPSGYILVDGELWRAETLGQSARIDVGATVRVVGSDRLTLIVEAVAVDE